jgi:hypothetical protein
LFFLKWILLTTHHKEIIMYKTDPRIPVAAQAIQAQLPQLLDSTSAEILKIKLQERLQQQQQGEYVDLAIVKLLEEHPATCDWLEKYLDNDTINTKDKSYHPLAGEREHIPKAEYYGCPNCDYRWTKVLASQRLPNCPTHNIELIKDA